MDDEDYQVSSEIYEEYDYSSTSIPKFGPGYVVSKFEFTLPQLPIVEKDEDGDFIVPRKKETSDSKHVIEIEHLKSTIIKMVGLQIWRGAFLLADWLIHNHAIVPKDSYVLELGSGVGLTSIVAAMFNPVFCTDIDKGDILNVIRSNVNRNHSIMKHPIKTFELDFMSSKLPQDIEDNLSQISLIIAADTVYDDDITEAFVKTVELLLKKSPSAMVYIALEKRFVFTIAECDSCAPCYDYFLECLQQTKNLKYEEVPLDFPKFFHYDRVNELVLWKIINENS